jgi:hypothetical protein
MESKTDGNPPKPNTINTIFDLIWFIQAHLSTDPPEALKRRSEVPAPWLIIRHCCSLGKIAGGEPRSFLATGRSAAIDDRLISGWDRRALSCFRLALVRFFNPVQVHIGRSVAVVASRTRLVLGMFFPGTDVFWTTGRSVKPSSLLEQVQRSVQHFNFWNLFM